MAVVSEAKKNRKKCVTFILNVRIFSETVFNPFWWPNGWFVVKFLAQTSSRFYDHITVIGPFPFENHISIGCMRFCSVKVTSAIYSIRLVVGILSRIQIKYQNIGQFSQWSDCLYCRNSIRNDRQSNRIVELWNCIYLFWYWGHFRVRTKITKNVAFQMKQAFLHLCTNI